jgi:threonine aldolase
VVNSSKPILVNGSEPIDSYGFLTNSTTNQIFPVLPNVVIGRLRNNYGFHPWLKVDDESTAIRLVTSWATKEAAVDEFIADLKAGT